VDRGTRIVKLVLFALVPVCAAVFLPGATAQTSPVFKVSFHVTGVTKSRPPNVVEIRVAAKGTLLFDEVPNAGEAVYTTDDASVKVVVEYDVITPHPRTEQVTFGTPVSGEARYQQDETADGTVTSETLSVPLLVDEGTLPCAQRPGSPGTLIAARNAARNTVAYALVLDECHVTTRQSATATRNGRVHVDFIPVCLRHTAGSGGKPLCGSGLDGTYNTYSGAGTPTSSGRAHITLSGSAIKVTNEYGDTAAGTYDSAGKTITLTSGWHDATSTHPLVGRVSMSGGKIRIDWGTLLSGASGGFWIHA
jgi:hypothetical protein